MKHGYHTFLAVYMTLFESYAHAQTAYSPCMPIFGKCASLPPSQSLYTQMQNDVSSRTSSSTYSSDSSKRVAVYYGNWNTKHVVHQTLYQSGYTFRWRGGFMIHSNSTKPRTSLVIRHNKIEIMMRYIW